MFVCPFVCDGLPQSNCKLECAWAKAKEICGCRPWYVPASDGDDVCFVLGNVCFSQTMVKIKEEKISVDCDCPEDCVYSRSLDAQHMKTVHYARVSPVVSQSVTLT